MTEKLCWACGRPIPAEATVCPHCRAPQQGAPTVMPADGRPVPPPATAQQTPAQRVRQQPVAPAVPQTPQQAHPMQPGPQAWPGAQQTPQTWPAAAQAPAQALAPAPSAPAPASAMLQTPPPAAARTHTRTRTRRARETPSAPRTAPKARPVIDPDAPLGPEFAGTPAGVGRRLAALTVDAVLIASAGALTAWLTSLWIPGASWILGIVVAVEAAVILVVVEGRTGATPGKLLMRVRVAQESAPRSPGLGRSSVRGITTVFGGLVAVVGAWGLELTALADRTGRRRSLADRAAGTVMVALPDRAARTTPVAASAATPSHTPAIAVSEAFSALESTGATTGGTSGSATGRVPQNTDERGPQSGPVPVQARGEGMGALEATGLVVPGGVLLMFDTGQRELLPARAIVNLGRTPSASVEGDLTVRVEDPSRTISKNHVRLEQARSGAWVTDLGSTNGTSLVREDGTATVLKPGERVAVEDGVRVRMGDRWFSISRLMEEDS